MSSDGIEEVKGYVLKAFSNNAAKKIILSLQEAGVPFVNIGKIGEKYALLLSGKRHYIKAKKLLKNKKLVFF